ncbi:MAG: hypothetical protein RL274_2694 [Pseudomonadota bacterium]
MKQTLHRKQKADSQKRPSLEDKLKAQTRLSDSDKKTLAVNLGLLCQELNPEKPLAGVNSLIEKSGLQNLRQKRKRFIRLPGEPTPDTGEKGEYGSSGATFANLAATAATMLTPSSREDVMERARQDVFRKLLKGTSFLPVYVPRSTSDRAAKSLLDDYAALISDALSERTRIKELWKVLEDTAIGLEHFNADQMKSVPPSEYGPAADLPPALQSGYYSKKTRFKPEEGWFDWHRPYLSIGKVELKAEAEVFKIPKSISKHFSEKFSTDEGFGPAATKWLNSISDKNEELPSVYASEDDEYGWTDMMFSVVLNVGLHIKPGPDGRPTLGLAVGGYDDMNWFSHVDRTSYIDTLTLFKEEYHQCRLDFWITDDFDYPYIALYREPYKFGAKEPAVFGIMPLAWVTNDLLFEFTPSRGGTPDESPWTDDWATSELLLGHEAKFYPSIPDSAPDGVPLSPGSIGASLIANLERATDDNRIDKLLIEKARLTAEAGLNFHEAMVDRSRRALLKIKSD